MPPVNQPHSPRPRPTSFPPTQQTRSVPALPPGPPPPWHGPHPLPQRPRWSPLRLLLEKAHEPGDVEVGQHRALRATDVRSPHQDTNDEASVPAERPQLAHAEPRVDRVL